MDGFCPWKFGTSGILGKMEANGRTETRANSNRNKVWTERWRSLGEGGPAGEGW